MSRSYFTGSNSLLEGDVLTGAFKLAMSSNKRSNPNRVARIRLESRRENSHSRGMSPIAYN